MGLLADLHTAWAKWRDGREAAPRRTRFTHPLPAFPLPRRQPLPDPLPQVAVVTPCKNAAPLLAEYAALVQALDYPRDRLHWIVLEGDSRDDTAARAGAMLAAAEGYATTRLLRFDVGFEPGAGGRGRVSIQRGRRSAIAACRNRLLEAAMETPADYILFIDVDMSEIPPDALRRALEWRAPVLAANCLRHEGEGIFDRNSFRYTRPVSDRMARRYVRDGIYQPPGGYFRHYPAPAPAPRIEPLSCVGGTFLLIRRDVVAAGTDFPEQPYQLHIETEGFALKAADLGFGSFMDAGLLVRHGPH
jgi:glycosyltransferase involved in cell wall biosynthesis